MYKYLINVVNDESVQIEHVYHKTTMFIHKNTCKPRQALSDLSTSLNRAPDVFFAPTASADQYQLRGMISTVSGSSFLGFSTSKLLVTYCTISQLIIQSFFSFDSLFFYHIFFKQWSMLEHVKPSINKLIYPNSWQLTHGHGWGGTS